MFRVRVIKDSSSMEIIFNDQMIEGSLIREHVMLKGSLIGSLQRARFLVGFSTFINVVVTILSPC